MGWFSNPACPKCGRETTETGYCFPYPQYRCRPCMNKSKQEKKDKDKIKELEARLNALESN